MVEPSNETSQHPSRERAHAIIRALKRHRSRLTRKLDAVRGDLREAEGAPLFRLSGEALLTYLHLVPVRGDRAVIPDPMDHSRNLVLEIDPKLSPHANAARYFKLAAKAERALEEIPPRLAAIEQEIAAVSAVLDRAKQALAPDDDPGEPVSEAIAKELNAALAKLPLVLQREVEPAPKALKPPTSTSVASGAARAPSAKLQPRRFKTAEGWDVLIGRSNEGNDYLTHTLARPEDYWFHVHGAPGSHVVLRRGKGKNEPSKRTIEEVASWTAFHSQAKNASKVPVIWTRKKYVRKPRKSPPGLAAVEREKMVMVKPVEPKVETEGSNA